MNVTSIRRRVPLALVQHANQYLITDGYDSREGISELLRGYAAVLRLHASCGVPLNLHLSGTLIESIAWHCPWFLTLLNDLIAAGHVTILGGTYSENVMPLFGTAFNRRQLREFLHVSRRHLRCSLNSIRVCWVPERVWDTARLAKTLTDPGLANGGYRHVLLDDRLLYCTGGKYQGSPRACFDAAGPFGSIATYGGAADLNGHPLASAGPPPPAETCRPYLIGGGHGLTVLPVSANLRYWVPPLYPVHWRKIEELLHVLGESHSTSRSDNHGPSGMDGRALLVYADDLEKSAGVGPWDPSGLDRYGSFLRWVASREDVAAVRLPEWLDEQPCREEREIQTGTYFELAQGWRAGEDYHGWSGCPEWSRYEGYLAAAQAALHQAKRQGADPRLLRLGWKHLLACTYETAWQWPDDKVHGPKPAAWAKALASHARTCLVIAAAACWFGRTNRGPLVRLVDIDDDGEQEVVLSNERLYAVLSPAQGGRLVYLFVLTRSGGALVIGNPSDDWNWQEELNRYMDLPANHPGALADVGFEHDRYEVSMVGAAADQAFVEIVNVQRQSAACGAKKSIRLAARSAVLLVSYRLPEGCETLATEACLSPDYHRLLNDGRHNVKTYQGETWRGFRHHRAAVWIARAANEATAWAEPVRAEAGHGLNVRLAAATPRFRLAIGCGKTDDERCRRLFDQAIPDDGVLHAEAREAVVRSP